MIASFLNNFQLDIPGLLIRIFVLCLSLSFHEFSHAWVANRQGDDTAAMQGRLTLNPLAHLDPVGSLVFLLVGIGWARPVPVNPARFTRGLSVKSGMMRVSLAGPLSNLFLALIATILYYSVLTVGILTETLTGGTIAFLLRLLEFMYFANVILAVFNLLPVPPLDGFKIFGSLLPNHTYYKILQYERYVGMVFLVLVLFGRGFLGTILSTIQIPFNYIINTPVRFLFDGLWNLIGIA